MIHWWRRRHIFVSEEGVLFWRYLLLVAVIFLLTACKPARQEMQVPERFGEIHKEEPLGVLFHSGYLPANVVEMFSRETGIPVAVQVCDSDVEMQRLFSESPDAYDVLQPGESLAAEWVHSGKLAPLSYQSIPNLRYLDSCFLGMPFDPSNRYTVPYLAGVMGIAYNSERVQGEVRRYADIFTQKYAGRIVIPNDSREIVACALAELHLHFERLVISNAEEIRKQLSRWMPLIGKYDPRIPPQAFLRRGEAVAAILESGDAAILIREDPKFKWVVPSVGAHLCIKSLAIGATSFHRKQAEQFINFLLRPDISAKISRQYPYFNPNFGARRLLPKEDQRCLCLLPKDLPKQTLQILPSLDSKIFQSVVEFVDGLRPK